MFVVSTWNGEGEVCCAFAADILDDHVDFDVGIGNCAEDLVGNAGFVRYAAYVDACLVFVECDTSYGCSFHVVVLFKGNQGAVAAILQAAEYAQAHFVFSGEFYGADL